MSYTTPKACRACGCEELHPVFSLGNQPLANDFCRPNEARQGFYPLTVLLCARCQLAQLSAIVDREQLYRHYSYVSSSSQTMQRHYDRLFKDIVSEQPARASIVEIASNDGGCLKFAKAQGFEVLGIDPAQNLAEIANLSHIDTIPDFFRKHVASQALDMLSGRHPGVILARHVLAHIDDWNELFADLQVLASKDTLIVFEFPYVLDLLQKLSWDTIYHEHLSMISLKPIVAVLKNTPFHIHRLTRVGVHGGALVMMLRHNDHPAVPHLSVDEMLSEEHITSEHWGNFCVASNEKVAALRNVILKYRESGKIISAFGASAKGTVMINACNLRNGEIAFVTDNTPLKPGRLVPGTDIPVIPEDEMLSHHPDYALCSAWNYRTEILAKMQKWRDRGGKFIFPEREIEIV